MPTTSFPWATDRCIELLEWLPDSRQPFPKDRSAIPEHLRNEFLICLYQGCVEESNPVVEVAQWRADHPEPGHQVNAVPPWNYDFGEKPCVRRSQTGDACLAELRQCHLLDQACEGKERRQTQLDANGMRCRD